ncbi:hypothetical protein HK405_007781 [Cladochytrium tenue]|nr:hypothetical protein HK405_007781 [Cladochytrium tenue]
MRSLSPPDVADESSHRSTEQQGSGLDIFRPSTLKRVFSARRSVDPPKVEPLEAEKTTIGRRSTILSRLSGIVHGPESSDSVAGNHSSDSGGSSSKKETSEHQPLAESKLVNEAGKGFHQGLHPGSALSSHLAKASVGRRSSEEAPQITIDRSHTRRASSPLGTRPSHVSRRPVASGSNGGSPDCELGAPPHWRGQILPLSPQHSVISTPASPLLTVPGGGRERYRSLSAGRAPSSGVGGDAPAATSGESPTPSGRLTWAKLAQLQQADSAAGSAGELRRSSDVFSGAARRQPSTMNTPARGPAPSMLGGPIPPMHRLASSIMERGSIDGVLRSPVSSLPPAETAWDSGNRPSRLSVGPAGAEFSGGATNFAVVAPPIEAGNKLEQQPEMDSGPLGSPIPMLTRFSISRRNSEDSKSQDPRRTSANTPQLAGAVRPPEEIDGIGQESKSVKRPSIIITKDKEKTEERIPLSGKPSEGHKKDDDVLNASGAPPPTFTTRPHTIPQQKGTEQGSSADGAFRESLRLVDDGHPSQHLSPVGQFVASPSCPIFNSAEIVTSATQTAERNESTGFVDLGGYTSLLGLDVPIARPAALHSAVSVGSASESDYNALLRCITAGLTQKTPNASTLLEHTTSGNLPRGSNPADPEVPRAELENAFSAVLSTGKEAANVYASVDTMSALSKVLGLPLNLSAEADLQRSNTTKGQSPRQIVNKNLRVGEAAVGSASHSGSLTQGSVAPSQTSILSVSMQSLIARLQRDINRELATIRQEPNSPLGPDESNGTAGPMAAVAQLRHSEQKISSALPLLEQRSGDLYISGGSQEEGNSTPVENVPAGSKLAPAAEAPELPKQEAAAPLDEFELRRTDVKLAGFVISLPFETTSRTYVVSEALGVFGSFCNLATVPLHIGWPGEMLNPYLVAIGLFSDTLMLQEQIVKIFRFREDIFGRPINNITSLAWMNLVAKRGLLWLALTIPYDVIGLKLAISNKVYSGDFWSKSFVMQLDPPGLVRAVQRLVKSIATVFIVIHILACVMFATSQWDQSKQSWAWKENLMNQTFYEQYTYAFHNAQIGLFFDIKSTKTDSEKFVAIVISLIAAINFGVLFGVILAVVKSQSKTRASSFEKEESIKEANLRQHMVRLGIPPGLQDDVLRHRRHRFLTIKAEEENLPAFYGPGFGAVSSNRTWGHNNYIAI